MPLDPSILSSTKKVVGLAADDDSFDQDVLIQINSAFSILHDLGVGPPEGFTVEDEEAKWEDFLPNVTKPTANLARTVVQLHVRLNFDPPQTSYLLDALKEQLKEQEWRLSRMREATEWVDPETTLVPDVVEIDGGDEIGL